MSRTEARKTGRAARQHLRSELREANALAGRGTQMMSDLWDGSMSHGDWLSMMALKQRVPGMKAELFRSSPGKGKPSAGAHGESNDFGDAEHAVKAGPSASGGGEQVDMAPEVVAKQRADRAGSKATSSNARLGLDSEDTADEPARMAPGSMERSALAQRAIEAISAVGGVSRGCNSGVAAQQRPLMQRRLPGSVLQGKAAGGGGGGSGTDEGALSAQLQASLPGKACISVNIGSALHRRQFCITPLFTPA